MPSTRHSANITSQAGHRCCLHHLFETQVRAAPHAVAIEYEGQSITFAELDAKANAVASVLRDMGVTTDVLVAIYLERGPSMIAALLGVWKAGGAYLPIDPALPSERIAYILADAAPQAVITVAALRARLPDLSHANILDLDAPGCIARLTQYAQDQNTAPQIEDQTSEQLAYVIYTSGSTGKPKGVAMPHGPLLHLMHWQLRQNPEHLRPRTLQFSALGFDVAFQDIFSTLSAGATLVLTSEYVRRDMALLAQAISEQRIQRIFMPFIALAQFTTHAEQENLYFPDLQQIITAGEQLRSDGSLIAFFERHPNCRLQNQYGPTETHVVTFYDLPEKPADWPSLPPIGKPFDEARIVLLDTDGRVCTLGTEGEIGIAGPVLARGYLNRPDLTKERFIPDPQNPDGRIYRSGDLGRVLPDGNIAYLGRNDSQIKVRGHRVELGEIEVRLRAHPQLADAAVIVRDDLPQGHDLVAYFTTHSANQSTANPPIPTSIELRDWLATTLPDYMLPGIFLWLDQMPISPNGKLDRRALPKPHGRRPDLSTPYLAAHGAEEKKVCDAFAHALGLERVGRLDNFFDLGGNSLLVLRVLALLSRDEKINLSASAFFSQPTPAALARLLQAASNPAGVAIPQLDSRRLTSRMQIASYASEEGEQPIQARKSDPIAIVGMAGRFPGAADVEAFWDMLLAGRDGIRHFADAELDPSLPTNLTGDSDYVKARGVIDGVDLFDPAFFGISPREAELMDPQQRIFLELCWECIERAGHAPDRTQGPVGVFAGMYNATYFLRHVQHRPDLIEPLGDFTVMLANEKDYIANRVANRLNLTGPAVSVHTACSTSLVAIAQAVTSLRAGQCDMALAGGSSVTCPPSSGYLYQEGAMLSPDGVTRTFDANSQGTVFSDAAAVVLLKRLTDAQTDGDTIYAVIRGVAINNDGRDKASFTAPSVDGQAAVVAAAQRDAGIDPRSVSYVECHGTATPMGDPVEVEALTRAFRQQTADIGFCRLGSAKSNVGHTVIAAGATGMIKTALALYEQRIPPSIHYTAPNPKIDFASSPFIVNDTLTPWPRHEQPRRAGVSGFGVGGTNAHVVLEEAPEQAESSTAVGPQLLMLSARSPAALETMAANLSAHLQARPDANLADVAYTLQVGRSAFVQRLCVVANTAEQAAQALTQSAWPLRTQRKVGSGQAAQIWLFPGQGAQYPSMGSGIYAADADFRTAFDAALAAFAPHLTFDLRARMFSSEPDALTGTGTTQPATFCLEYALAQTWLARGAEPAALIGHSVGEFVAAVLAGVMSLADAARLVAHRGALMQALPPGSMLSVRLSVQDVIARLPAELSLAAENGPTACVVAGPTPSVESFRAAIEAAGVQARLLQTSHAFHSSMMDPALEPFAAEVASVSLSAPHLPIISTRTGTWLTDAEATSTDYWVRHLREPVRFSPAVREALTRHTDAVFLEIGPRGSLSTLARQHAPSGGTAPIVAVQSLADTPESEAAHMLLAQGALWTAGIDLSASASNPATGRRRVRLPTYPFERKRFWVDAQAQAPTTSLAASVQPGATSTASLVAPAANVLAFVPPAFVPAMTTTQPNSAPASRKDSLIARLRDLFEDVSGSDVHAADPGIPFIELGIDSLTLTQAALQVKKQFAVPVTFRQLMEDLRSFDLLATYLDAQLPPEPAAPIALAASPAAVPAPTSVPGVTAMTLPIAPVTIAPQSAAQAGSIQWLIQQQMQLMSQQLALLGGQPMVAAPAAIPAPVVQAPAAAAVAAAPAVQSAPGDTEDTAPQRYDVKKAFGAIARIHTQASPLTARQKARLAAFMRRYVERTAKSRAYTVDYRNHLADPRVVNGFRPMTKEITYQIVVERSKGAHMWDLDGNQYVDVLNGFGMSLFGWQPDFVLDAVRKQLDDGYDIGPQHPLAGPVADLLCELTGFDRAGLCNTGSEAVMAAVRIARTVTGRNTVVLFSGSYHGTFDEVVVRPGKNAKGIPGAPGIMRGMFGDVRVLDYGTPESLEFIRANAADLAAVLVEPVQSRRPEFRPVDFLKEVRAITEHAGTCLIFDEVITGFRSALGGTQALFGIRADLATYGKVIGGGMPIGVVAGKRDFMDALDGGPWQFGDDSIPSVGVTYFAGTFVRHPLALAAAHASLLHLKEQGPALQERLNAATTALAEELSAFCREVGAPLEIRHFASLWRVGWLEDHPLQDLLFAMMRSRGVHILDNFPCFLTTAHSEADIRLVATAFKDSVHELQESEFLPRRASPLAVAFDATKPPVPGARLGKDASGKPAWFVPNPAEPGRFLKVGD